LLDEPPREPAAERRAVVRAAFAPERAPVAAALVVRRAPDAALRAVLRADDVVLRERELLLREREDELLLRERELELDRRRLDERRVPPARWSRGISFFATSLTSCGISFSR
jgi:hypothetical protein